MVEVVEVTGVRIDVEMKGASKSNLTDIKNNIEKFAGSSKSGEKKAEKEEESDEPSSDAPAPLLKKIDLTSMSISFSSSTLKSSVPVPLAPIYLRNVGGKGEPLGESIMEIFDSLMSAVNGVGGVVLGGIEVVGDAGKALGDGVSKGAKNIGDSISGIFK